MGGGQNFNAPKSTLYTIKTHYKIFGIQIFAKTTTQICKTQSLSIGTNIYIGKYITTSPNIEQEILALISGLSKENQAFVLRQIHREKHAFENKSERVDIITQNEKDELIKIYTDFTQISFNLAKIFIATSIICFLLIDLRLAYFGINIV